MAFPEKFAWGAADASVQIEGAASEDGKGLSVQDVWARQPGNTWGGNTPEIASDHYHHYEEDAHLMKEIGLKAYRLSISWPRVMPSGKKPINEKGLVFYDRLVDALLQNKVEPWVTLFHWDYPHSLFKEGGWLHPESAEWFAEYVRVVIDKISDRVSHWITLNEPQCVITIGHQLGLMAPGLRLDVSDAISAAHNHLLAHGKAVQTIRAYAKKKPLIGAAPVGLFKIPATNNPEDIKIAKSLSFSATLPMELPGMPVASPIIASIGQRRDKHFFNNTWFADPMLLGRYPEDGVKNFGSDMPIISARDMETICQPLDFFGFNCYRAHGVVRSTGDGGFEQLPTTFGPPLSSKGWEMTPEVLYWGPLFLYERYKLPVVVTENGMANPDWVHLDGRVHDTQRIDWITRYLIELKRATEDGTEVRGYFLWSLMDDWDWEQGFKARFGLIHVDFNSGIRTLKDSAYWYKKVIDSNGEILTMIR